MKAVLFERFGERPELTTVADPAPPAHGVVVRVMATGVCRSDWHGWMGHDPDIRLPHVPGHELAGVIEAVGAEVRDWAVGDRVTVPFICACGACPPCQAGDQQVCDAQCQPGFTHWGSFAEYVALHHADVNLVRLPEGMAFDTAASLGCRFATSYRAVVDQGRVAPEQWVAVHGCGGVGLSAVMIARAFDARVVAVDISDAALALARDFGAEHTVNADQTDDPVATIRELTGGGAHLSLDALGHPTTCANSVRCLRKRGRHVQVGLLLADQSTPPIPMAPVIAHELEIVGSHGMQAHRYPEMLELIAAGRLTPELLIRERIALPHAIDALTTMDRFQHHGVTVITEF